MTRTSTPHQHQHKPGASSPTTSLNTNLGKCFGLEEHDGYLPVDLFQLESPAPAAKLAQPTVVVPGFTPEQLNPPAKSEPVAAEAYRSYLMSGATSSEATKEFGLRRAARDLGWPGCEEDLSALPWHLVTAEDCQTLVRAWRSDLSNGTIKSYLSSVRGVARACAIRRIMPSDQYMLIKEVSAPKGRNRKGKGRCVEVESRNTVMDECASDDTVRGLRDRAMIALMFCTGMRRAEIASLLDQDIDLDNRDLTVTVKGGDTVQKFIPEMVIEPLQLWRQARRTAGFKKGPFFCRVLQTLEIRNEALTGPGIRYVLRRRSDLADLDRVINPHDCRRTLATELIATKGEGFAQLVLGHANLSTTLLYDRRSEMSVRAGIKDLSWGSPKQAEGTLATPAAD